MKNWQNTIVATNHTIREAMRAIDNGGVRLALVADESFHLLGTVTDGDIRRGLLRDLEMNDSILDVMNHSPISADENMVRDDLLALIDKHDLLALPIVNRSNKLVGLSTLNQLMQPETRDNPVFIMAGGFGSRLKPLTDNCPKPMLPIGDKPMLAHILDLFIKQGFSSFYISTHYMPEVITEYFGDGDKFGCNITYVHEDSPLGTGGALSLLPENLPRLPLVMINGDILTDVDFTKMIDTHMKNKNDVTLCLREEEHQVAYGLVETTDGIIQRMVEKPTYRYLINSGIYVLSAAAVLSVKESRKMALPSLVEDRISQGFKVGEYRSHGYWLDVGRMSDYQKAQVDIIGLLK